MPENVYFVLYFENRTMITASNQILKKKQEKKHEKKYEMKNGKKNARKKTNFFFKSAELM